jgi:hypothetical protein
MDPTVQVAAIGILTTLVTTAGIVVVAIINNRKERGSSAESAMERTLRERILLRDEQIQELRQDIADRDKRIAELMGWRNE